MKEANLKVGMLKQLFQIGQQKKANQKFRLRGGRKGMLAMDETAAEDSNLKNLIQFIKTETPLPEAATQWLGLLGLLYGVPFNNLVADEKMLSNDILAKDLTSTQWLKRLADLYNIDSQSLKAYEGNLDNASKERLRTNALRFFYVDLNWIDSLIDGALSIGVHNSVDYQLQLAVHKAFKEEIEQAMVNHRVLLRGQQEVPKYLPERLGTFSGLLFRSPIVAQWTGLEIIGYKTATADPEDDRQMVDILRMERLSPNIMMVLFKGVPQKVTIKEPSESIYSGLQRQGENDFRLVLRNFTDQDDIGKPYEKNGTALTYSLDPKADFRSTDQRVLNISNLRKNVLKSIKGIDKSVKTNGLSPKDMGVEWINAPRTFNYVRAQQASRTRSAKPQKK
ncbi:MAG: hypothetical protein AAF990_22480 [Bacteroidota bacterium]